MAHPARIPGQSWPGKSDSSEPPIDFLQSCRYQESTSWVVRVSSAWHVGDNFGPPISMYWHNPDTNESET